MASLAPRDETCGVLDRKHLVTDMPFSFPPAHYVHPTPIIPVCCRPSDNRFVDLDVLAWHEVHLYVTALAAVNP
jgi:hypothetical protein